MKHHVMTGVIIASALSIEPVPALAADDLPPLPGAGAAESGDEVVDPVSPDEPIVLPPPVVVDDPVPVTPDEPAAPVDEPSTPQAPSVTPSVGGVPAPVGQVKAEDARRAVQTRSQPRVNGVQYSPTSVTTGVETQPMLADTGASVPDQILTASTILGAGLAVVVGRRRLFDTAGASGSVA